MPIAPKASGFIVFFFAWGDTVGGAGDVIAVYDTEAEARAAIPLQVPGRREVDTYQIFDVAKRRLVAMFDRDRFDNWTESTPEQVETRALDYASQLQA